MNLYVWHTDWGDVIVLAETYEQAVELGVEATKGQQKHDPERSWVCPTKEELGKYDSFEMFSCKDARAFAIKSWYDC